jgi:hypothetical protein
MAASFICPTLKASRWRQDHAYFTTSVLSTQDGTQYALMNIFKQTNGSREVGSAHMCQIDLTLDKPCLDIKMLPKSGKFTLTTLE